MTSGYRTASLWLKIRQEEPNIYASRGPLHSISFSYLLQVSERFGLPWVKLQKMYEGNPGKSILVRVSARFELRVRVACREKRNRNENKLKKGKNGWIYPIMPWNVLALHFIIHVVVNMGWYIQLDCLSVFPNEATLRLICCVDCYCGSSRIVTIAVLLKVWKASAQSILAYIELSSQLSFEVMFIYICKVFV